MLSFVNEQRKVKSMDGFDSILGCLEKHSIIFKSYQTNASSDLCLFLLNQLSNERQGQQFNWRYNQFSFARSLLLCERVSRVSKEFLL